MLESAVARSLIAKSIQGCRKLPPKPHLSAHFFTGTSMPIRRVNTPKHYFICIPVSLHSAQKLSKFQSLFFKAI
jgi:hypothetical protein